MKKKICFLGLSGSGKTCYKYAVCDALSSGMPIGNHVISITCTSLQQQIKLNEGIELIMANKVWPDGSNATDIYPFELRLDSKTIGEFELFDYAGGLLYITSDQIQDKFKKLLEGVFKESSCIVYFIDGVTLLHSLPNESLSQKHINSITLHQQTKARNRIKYIEPLLLEVCKNRNLPILLTITKRDVFSPDELEKALHFLHNLLPSLFSRNNDKVIGVTTITLGDNLQNIDKKISGNINISPKGNIHIPLLFALFQTVDFFNVDSPDLSEVKEIAKKIFSPDKIKFYIGGELALAI